MQGTTTDSFVYDATGSRILRKEKDSTTLHLPSGNELKLDKTGTLTGTRYYGDVAMRTGGKLTFTLADHHNTGTTQITADTTQTVTRRKTGLFGEARGTQPTAWTGEKTFVGGTKDNDSGLTHIGAREYDPLIGRFISVDPIMDLTDSQQLHGYTYSANNPFTYSDPDGLKYFPGGNEDPGFQASPQSVIQAATRYITGYGSRITTGSTCGRYCSGPAAGSYVKFPGNPPPKKKPVVYVQTASGYPARGVPQGSILDPNKDAAGGGESETDYWFNVCMGSGDGETLCQMKASWYASGPVVGALAGSFSAAALSRGGALGQSCTTCGPAEPPAAPRTPLPLPPAAPGIPEVRPLYGPFHRLGGESKTQTQGVTDKVVASGELWGTVPRNAIEPAAQAHNGPLPRNAREGSFEFYTTARPTALSVRTGYVSWDAGRGRSGIREFHFEGKDWAAIPAFVTSQR
ncbi:RHS repeat-associated core domain-containing protein [Streptomyces sp. NPDC091273]|uniref:RHS repeat-associated core domain-containing protein n=1 Tax=Streptomyces sp. NPDC091273 TaxID=3365982 RepID=UPI003822B146